MSGKKKPRVTRWVPANPIGYAKIMAAPIDATERAQVNARRHAALIRYAEGNANSADLTMFEYLVYIGRAVAESGQGIEVLEVADQAQAAIDDARRRMDLHELGAIGPGPGDYDTMQLLVALIDMQMQSVGRNDYQACQRRAIGALQRAGLFKLPEEARP